MVSRKMYVLVILALLNSCSPTITVNTPSATPSVIVTSPSPTSLINSSSSPLPVATSTPIPIPSNLSTLSFEEIKQITDSNIVKADNTFGINLYKEIVKEQVNENLFISPVSVALAMHITYNGADGNTKDEMTKTLKLDNLSLENVNSLNNLLVKKLINPSADIRLDVANSLWFDKNRFTFKDDYKKNVTNYYNAESNERNFSDPATVTAINNWASQNTNGKIPEVIKGIDKDVVGYLINAVYFKADWTEKFDKTQTELREFTLADGSKKNVMMMSDFRTYKYFNKARSSYPNPYDPTLGFEGIELTYGKEANVSLIMFLPDAKSSLEKFYSQLNEENLEKWLGGFYRNEGYISFPKFKNEWNRNISNNIRNMGIREAFSPLTAQFEKMGTSSLGNVYISKVLHNSYVDVNEEGTEAAAVTVIETAAASSAPTARFVADRPFFYIIRDNQTKSILFMGAVNDPKYEN